MKSSALGVAGVVIVAGAAIGLTMFLGSDDPTPQAATGGTAALLERLEAVERRLASLEGRAGNASASLAAAGPQSGAPVTSAGLARAAALPESSASEVPAGSRPEPGTAVAGAKGSESTSEAVTAKVLGAVDQKIDEAVDKKIEELERKKNKKPSLDTVVELLELDASQRQLVEHESRKGQRQIRNVLEVPTANGTSLLDELVDVMAYGQAKRPETGALWGKWIKRIMNEKVPGTDQTYAAQIELAKDSVRKGFQRVMSEEQYTEFKEWNFDPTEIQGISDSAWDDLQKRIADRATTLPKPQ